MKPKIWLYRNKETGDSKGEGRFPFFLIVEFSLSLIVFCF